MGAMFFDNGTKHEVVMYGEGGCLRILPFGGTLLDPDDRWVQPCFVDRFVACVDDRIVGAPLKARPVRKWVNPCPASQQP